MGFLAEVEAEVKHPGAQPCAVARVLETITDDTFRADLVAAIRDTGRFTGAAIERALRGRQIKLAASKIQYHRRGDCACPADTKPPKAL